MTLAGELLSDLRIVNDEEAYARIEAELAAAEERGRRRGVDALRAAHEYCLYMFKRDWLTDPRNRSIFAARIFEILDAALAPRDSGPASIPEGAVHHDCPLVGCQIIGKHEHRIEGPSEARK